MNTALIVSEPTTTTVGYNAISSVNRRKENARRLFPATKDRAEAVSQDAGQERREGDDAFSTCCRFELTQAFY